jgi:hypothetical protein
MSYSLDQVVRATKVDADQSAIEDTRRYLSPPPTASTSTRGRPQPPLYSTRPAPPSRRQRVSPSPPSAAHAPAAGSSHLDRPALTAAGCRPPSPSARTRGTPCRCSGSRPPASPPLGLSRLWILRRLIIWNLESEWARQRALCWFRERGGWRGEEGREGRRGDLHPAKAAEGGCAPDEAHCICGEIHFACSWA